MDLKLNGQVALVAAASRGLGKASAKALAAEGARLAICARSDVLDQAAAEIRGETGAEVLAIRADLTVPADITQSALEAQAMVAPDVHRWTDGKTIRKIIVIPGRLVNIVAT